MSSTTPTIGLKKPEGSDPFLTEDFAANYDKIDAAFAARPAGGSGGAVDAATLGGSPKSYFYGPHNPPPATGVGSHTHDAYAPISHTHGDGGGSGMTLAEADARYAPISHGSHDGGGGSTYTLPADVVRSPGRTNPRVIMSVTGYAFNNQNGVVITPTFGHTFTSQPTVVVTPHQGSNIDMVPNIQGRTTTEFSCRLAQVKGVNVTTTGSLCWVAIGP